MSAKQILNDAEDLKPSWGGKANPFDVGKFLATQGDVPESEDAKLEGSDLLKRMRIRRYIKEADPERLKQLKELYLEGKAKYEATLSEYEAELRNYLQQYPDFTPETRSLCKQIADETFVKEWMMHIDIPELRRYDSERRLWVESEILPCLMQEMGKIGYFANDGAPATPGRVMVTFRKSRDWGKFGSFKQEE